MKFKYLLIKLILLLTFSGVKAQEPGFIGGLILNFNGIQIEGQNEQFWSSITGEIWGGGGVSAGGFVKREFSDKVYGVFELRFIQKGSIYKFANQYGNKALELLKLHYVEVPVLAGFKVHSKQKPIFIESGLAYSKLIRSETAFNKLVERTDTPNAGQFKSIDISAVADVKFPVNRKQNLLIGGRVEYSVFSIHKYYNLHNLDYGIELNYLMGAGKRR